MDGLVWRDTVLSKAPSAGIDSSELLVSHGTATEPMFTNMSWALRGSDCG